VPRHGFCGRDGNFISQFPNAALTAWFQIDRSAESRLMR
jgi:hypothetical protein